MAVRLLIVAVPQGPRAEGFERDLGELIQKYGGDSQPKVKHVVKNSSEDIRIGYSADDAVFERLPGSESF